MKLSRKLTMTLAALLSFTLLAAACGDDAEEAITDADFIVVDEGEQVQIRSLNAITGDVAFLGVPNQNAVEAAIADYGDINGFEVNMGQGLDDLCSADGGQAAAQTIVADAQIAGVIGTSCSGAATAAAPRRPAAVPHGGRHPRGGREQAEHHQRGPALQAARRARARGGGRRSAPPRRDDARGLQQAAAAPLPLAVPAAERRRALLTTPLRYPPEPHGTPHLLRS